MKKESLGAFAAWGAASVFLIGRRGLLIFFSVLFAACAGTEFFTRDEPEYTSPALLTVPSPQETVYNAEPQPVRFYYGGGDITFVIYYPTAEARAKNNSGSVLPPVNAGTYYIKAASYNGGDALGEIVLAEYRILRRPVKIEAKAFQEAFYNGDPKRVAAEVYPAVPLSFSYYPNRELLEIAVNSAKEGEAVLSGRESYSGYRRVDRAPIEAGTYYVWISFAGDKNHESADAFVEFTIHPPRGVR